MKQNFLKSISISIVFLTIAQCPLFAQPSQKEYANLQTSYKYSKTDSSRVMILNQLAWLFRKYDKDKALKYSKKSIVVAEKADYLEGIGFGNMAIGNVYNYHSQHDSAIIYYRRAIPYLKEIKRNKIKNFRLGQLYYNLGMAYTGIGFHEESISSLIKSVEFFSLSNNKEKLASLYISIANIYETQKQYSKSLKYANIALEDTKRIKDTTEYCYVMNDLNNIFLSLHTETKNLKYLKRAKNNFYKTAAIIENSPHIDTDGIILPTILSNIGDCLMREMKYDSAVYYFKKSNLLGTKIKYDWIKGYNFTYLGEISIKKNQIEEANNYFKKALLYRKDHGGDDFSLKLY
ncbi:tetratricopeptide repeat protein, partial [Flavobacterium sp.]|uniref:tetratricopeptide repeat protein n=1 Tax=Flavobacterium sp. TaxID=239 RepID=UPI003750448D